MPAELRLRLKVRPPAPEGWVARLRTYRASLVRWLAAGVMPAPDLELISVAVGQGLGARLHRTVQAAGEAWPDDLRARLRDASRTSLVRSLTQLEVAAAVVSRLHAQGLRSLPLKGCAVAEWLYDSPAERQMGDVDLLCLDDWAGARRLLEGEGFATQEEADHAVSLYDARAGVTVELHRSVTSCPGLFPLDGEGLWSRSWQPDGACPRRPAAEDLLVQLALHATFQHGLVLTLGQYLDFRHLLERCRLDPDRLFACARAARAERQLAPALTLAKALVGAPVPPALAERAEAQLTARQRRWLRGLLADPLRSIAPAPASLARVRWVTLQGRRAELLKRTLRLEVRPSDHGWAGFLARAVRRAWRLADRTTRPAVGSRPV